MLSLSTKILYFIVFIVGMLIYLWLKNHHLHRFFWFLANDDGEFIWDETLRKKNGLINKELVNTRAKFRVQQ